MQMLALMGSTNKNSGFANEIKAATVQTMSQNLHDHHDHIRSHRLSHKAELGSRQLIWSQMLLMDDDHDDTNYVTDLNIVTPNASILQPSLVL